MLTAQSTWHRLINQAQPRSQTIVNICITALGYFFGTLMKKAAILIDAGFFMQRVHATHRKHFAEHELTAQCIMKVIWSMVLSHLNGKRQSQERREPLELYRIYFYDCPPLDIQTRLPLPEPGNKTPGRKNFKLEKSYILRTELHEELRKTRKTALRLGNLVDNKRWQLTTFSLDALMKGTKNGMN
ncbi:Uncharacterised protein [Escherichia coli]|nr:Uncharacterised protein [Escherichia coli]